MTQATPQIEADIAYLRQVAEGDGNLRPLAIGYLSACLVYGVQFVINWAWVSGYAAPPSPTVVAAMNLAPSGLLLALLVRAAVQKQRGAGVVGRAVDTIFNAALLAQMGAVAAMGLYAWRSSDWNIMYLAISVAFALQGGAWTAAGVLRKRAWMSVVAAGWFATGLGTAYAIGAPAFFVIASIGFFVCGALPGAVLLRPPAKPV
jgi:hypothetical protein